MKKSILTAAVFAVTGFAALGVAPVQASESGATPPHREWSFSGLRGTYDRNQLQRGLQVYREVCAACHGLSRVYFRNIEHLGYSEEQIKSLAAEYTVVDGPNDEGEMFDRPGRPSDHFVGPYANDQVARASNNGALPPDLSLMATARPGGADYLAALLTGYTEPPAGVEVMPGMYYNEYFPGHQIAMPKPLADGQVTYADGIEATTDQMAQDVSAFLTWAAEPHLEDRKRMGMKVVIFLTIFAFILYRVKRKVWSDVHH